MQREFLNKTQGKETFKGIVSAYGNMVPDRRSKMQEAIIIPGVMKIVNIFINLNTIYL